MAVKKKRNRNPGKSLYTRDFNMKKKVIDRIRVLTDADKVEFFTDEVDDNDDNTVLWAVFHLTFYDRLRPFSVSSLEKLRREFKAEDVELYMFFNTKPQGGCTCMKKEDVYALTLSFEKTQ